MISPMLLVLFLTACAVLMKALAAAERPRAICARCTRPLERRLRGEPICRCPH